MPYFDLEYFKSSKPRKIRKISLQKRFIAWKKDKEFYDGNRKNGYGGYIYDGRWLKILPKIIRRYKLNSSSKVLDIGCKKGFLIHDLKKLIPGIKCYGIEDHKYPIKHAIKSVKNDIKFSKYNNLPFKNNYFDFIIGFSSIYTYNFGDLVKIFHEMNRVSKNKKKIYITLAAFYNEKDFLNLMKWTTLSSTILSTKDWKKFFKLVNYKGDYFFTTSKSLKLKR
jgi:ubiquinone/menaquinone biosynthesis C-methylase UbiE